MRRIIVVLAFAGVLATTAACGSESTPTGTAATASATTAAPSPTADYTADTKKVCDELDKMLDTGLDAFASNLGKMIGYRQAKQPELAAKAKAAAQQDLKEQAEALRKATMAAQDPKMQAAGEEAAKGMVTTAASDAFFDKLKDMDDLNALETEMTVWLAPLEFFCG
jgi:hypothetical protein